MYIRHVTWHRIRTVLLCFATVAAGMLLLLRPNATTNGISRGLSICASVIIPTLFPFFVLSGFTARSGLAAAIGRRLEPLTRRLFGLPGCAATGILLAFIGGFPAGGAAVSDLLRTGQLTREEGERMMRFCVCGGPGYVIVTVGNRLLNCTAFGVVLLVANVLSALLIGIFVTPRSARQITRTNGSHSPSLSLPEAFTQSVSTACQSLLNTCGFVTLFSTILALLDALLPSSPALLPCLLEVSCGCLRAASLRGLAPLMLGFAVGFGGLSVHCQIAAALSGTGAFTPRFFISRLLHGLLTALLTVIALQWLPITLPVFSGSSTPIVQAFSGGVSMSVFTLLLCGIWLLSVDKGRAVTYNETSM